MAEGDFEKLRLRASRVVMTEGEKKLQRTSFAYGNANIENASVTKEMVKSIVEKLEREQGAEH